MQKKKSIVITAFGCALTLLLITSNFGPVLAKTETEVTLPDYLERSLQYTYKDATKVELNEKRIEWAKQVEISEEHRKTAIPPSGKSAHDYLIWADEEAWGNGVVYNEDNIIGLSPDSNVARICTPGLYDGGNIAGEASSSNAWGYVWVHAAEYAQIANGSDNYVMCYASNDFYAEPEEWDSIYYAKITSTSLGWVYIGYTTNQYKYWNFGCNVMGGDCCFNDIIIDCIGITHP